AFPAMANRPGLAFDCAVTRGGLPPLNSLMLALHARGGGFMQAASVMSGRPGEWTLSLDDPVSTMDLHTFWYGYHEDYDVTRWKNSVPISGVVKPYTLRRVLHTLLWARRHFLVDTTRVYAYGYSMAGIGSTMVALRRPDLFAGMLEIVSKFDFS